MGRRRVGVPSRLKLLLDTHVFAWATSAPKKLSRRAARILNDSQNETWLSPISVMELANLNRKGKLRLDRGFDQWMTESMTKLACREAPFTLEVALETRAIAMDNHDPADRIIAATARILDLTLVTADEALLAARNVPTMRA